MKILIGTIVCLAAFTLYVGYHFWQAVKQMAKNEIIIEENEFGI